MARRYAKGERRGGKNVDTYFYDDEHGEHYHKVERTEDHQFPQWTWALIDKEAGNYDWVPKQPKIKKPYNLPRLLAAPPEQPVFICEGEKDADTVDEFHLLNTTNPGGAGKWTKELTKWFKGKQTVYVLEDNDEPGRKHALHVATEMCRIGVPNVFIVRFNDLKEGGDVSDWVQETGDGKEEFLKRCAAAPRFTPRTVIRIEKGEIRDTVNAIEGALIKANAHVFERSAGVLVRPLWARRRAHDQDDLSDRSPKVSFFQALQHYPQAMVEIVNKHCVLEQYDRRRKDGEKWTKVDPPPYLVQHLLQRMHWGFGQVTGIVNVPTLRADGTVISEPGHDEKTGLWFYPYSDSVKLSDADTRKLLKPNKLSRGDALAALAKLEALLSECPFEAEQDRSVALAAMLTVVLRGAFVTAPMFMFNADTMGTGKSFLVDLIATLATGERCPVMTYVNNSEEMEKRIGSILIEGSPLISLDNVEGEIRSDLLCQMLTQPFVKVRILGKSETPKCEWRGTLFATGNNATLAGDITRRALLCTLHAGMEDPSKRKFKNNPLQTILADHGSFIAACLTIALAYRANKKKVECEPFASFEAWSSTVREPLIWLGKEDPGNSRDRVREADPERSQARQLITLWSECAPLMREGGITVRKIIEVANETRPVQVISHGADFEYVYPDLRDLLMTRCGGRGGVDAVRLGKWLGKLQKQTHLGWRVEKAQVSDAHGHTWTLRKAKS